MMMVSHYRKQHVGKIILKKVKVDKRRVEVEIRILVRQGDACPARINTITVKYMLGISQRQLCHYQLQFLFDHTPPE